MKNGTDSSIKLSIPLTAFWTMNAVLNGNPRSKIVTMIAVPPSAKATGTATMNSPRRTKTYAPTISSGPGREAGEIANEWRGGVEGHEAEAGGKGQVGPTVGDPIECRERRWPD